MIGRDDQSEEVTFKVADRRKFNADGTVREGVVFEKPEKPEKPEELEKPDKPDKPEASGQQEGEPRETDATDAASEQLPVEDPDDAEVGDDEAEEIPGAEDPASFVNFLSTLATNAAAALGAVPHPATGQRSVDLETGRYWLDVLAMLKEKSKGNLHSQEARLLDGLLAELRMQYVSMVRATEEKLKAQAAKKFSGADILGKK